MGVCWHFAQQVTNRYIAQLKDGHRSHPVVRDFFTKVCLLSMLSVCSVFRPHHLHVAHRCGLLLQMSHLVWSVSVGHTGELCKNGWTDWDMSFGGGASSCGSKEPCIMLLTLTMSLRTGRGTFVPTYGNVPTAENVSARRMRWRKCIRHHEGWHSDSASCQSTPDTSLLITVSCFLYWDQSWCKGCKSLPWHVGGNDESFLWFYVVGFSALGCLL